MSADRRQSDSRDTVTESTRFLRKLTSGGKRAGFILVASAQLALVIVGLAALWSGGINPITLATLLVPILLAVGAGLACFRSSFLAHEESSRRLRLLAEMN